MRYKQTFKRKVISQAGRNSMQIWGYGRYPLPLRPQCRHDNRDCSQTSPNSHRR